MLHRSQDVDMEIVSPHCRLSPIRQANRPRGDSDRFSPLDHFFFLFLFFLFFFSFFFFHTCPIAVARLSDP